MFLYKKHNDDNDNIFMFINNRNDNTDNATNNDDGNNNDNGDNNDNGNDNNNETEKNLKATMIEWIKWYLLLLSLLSRLLQTLILL